MIMAKKNSRYEINNLQLNKNRAQIKTANMLPKTGFFAENEDFQPGDKTGILKIGVSQSVSWPGLYKAQKNLYQQQLNYYQLGNAVIEADIKKLVHKAYYQLWFLQDKQQLFWRLDSIYTSLRVAAILKVKTGNSPGLDSISANVKMKELQALLQQLDKEMLIQQQELKLLPHVDELILPLQLL